MTIKRVFKKRQKTPDADSGKEVLMRQDDEKILGIGYNDKLDALLISHSIEKGMSLDKPYKQFGEDRAGQLLETLSRIDNDCFEYDASMSILEEYLKAGFCKDKNILERFSRIKKERGFNYLPSGVGFTEFSRKAQKFDLKGFLESRHDIRKTTNAAINEKDILKAIEIAKLAPSACNRQPWKVYYSMDGEKNTALGSIVSGNKAFANDMKYYCAIVLDHSYFSNRVDEFRQIYLNAGIFIAYFALSLHSLGIGSCIMQFTGFVEDADRKSRDILGLKESEQVMAIIGYGKYPQKIKYSKACRRKTSEIAVKF